MKTYQQQIQLRLRLSVGTAVAGVLAVAIAYLLRMVLYRDFTLNFHAEAAGLFLGIEAVSLSRIIRLANVLKNPDALEKMEIYEQDERNQSVVLKSNSTCLILLTVLVGIGAMVASFFSRTVFLTAGAILILLILLQLLCRVYYQRR